MGGMCRDRATASTENAIQNAHQDNHSAKAMEVVLANAQQQGVVFSDDVPLVPTLQDVKRMVSRQASSDRAAVPGRAPPRVRAQLRDTPDPGELTYFLGKGKPLRMGTCDAFAVLNAVGFFVYTQCGKNPSGQWPTVLCAFQLLCCALLSPSPSLSR